MVETFTFNALTNHEEVKKENLKDDLGADELMFYHSLRANLELLQKKPKLQTIHYILDYSKSSR
ncbi:hypothetical protein [Mucilaginibacter sp. UR6-11]|uniref:hypothetical protein n=1 Tax=Mucilaginibacter sp. UR6-11 TaxID=1435644 RepID=UPI001E64824F|nr:hypothetical protein [Mucilaginibacter sp. UR6-11]MCC8425385.1 hypothetical protein [Mucilaginibacter sp. UR6-11]